MIPLKIQIKNFLSYGNEIQTIDFSPYHLLCLSGKNGHGKSALLDAITWAIWGQARKTSNTAKADHGLLRLGQTHMLVILDFECNNTHYRIRREFALTYGKPYAAIDFGIVDETDDTIRPLTEKTIRGTQQKIEETIHLDYDAFINSAFLRQGQSNEFSKKSAKDRKEILANILGLQRYEQMRKLANDASREAAIQKQQLTTLQENSARELEKTTVIDQKLQETCAKLDELSQREAEMKISHTALLQERDILIQKQEAKNRLLKDLQDLAVAQEHAQDELRKLVREWRSIHAQHISAESPEALKAEQAELSRILQTLQEALAKKLEKKELYLKEKETMSLLVHALKTKQQDIIHRILLELQQTQVACAQQEQLYNSTEKQVQQLKLDIIGLQREIVSYNKTINDFPADRFAALEKQFEKRRQMYQQWIAQANCLKNELDQMQQKKLITHEDNSSSCPLCEQNLSAARKKFLKTKLSQEEQFSVHRYTRLTKLLKKLKQILLTQHEEITQLKTAHTALQITVHQKNEAEKKIIALQSDVVAAEKLSRSHLDGLAKLKKNVAEQEAHYKGLQDSIEQSIKLEPEYSKQLNILKECEAHYTAIIYDHPAHEKTKLRIAEITQKLLSYEKLQNEVRMQLERKRTIETSCIHLKKLKSNIELLQKQLIDFANLDQLNNQHSAKELHLKEQIEKLIKEKNLLLQEKGQYTQHLAMLAKLKEEYAQQSIKINQLSETAQDYQAIATALGKNGIQALLIEDAIPEIEHEANDLLGKLTDNQAHIFIESLRDLKSGGTAETLDIKISDAAGVRAYELFSGGEAFRIDFALRIAISKLLARRAGTSLQTLIIDEGFGSQDDDGLSYIMDALYKIQDDFKKIIIVSHLPRLKDQFPVHFCVQKGSAGSTVRIIEQA